MGNDQTVQVYRGRAYLFAGVVLCRSFAVHVSGYVIRGQHNASDAGISLLVAVGFCFGVSDYMVYIVSLLLIETPHCPRYFCVFDSLPPLMPPRVCS